MRSRHADKAEKAAKARMRAKRSEKRYAEQVARGDDAKQLAVAFGDALLAEAFGPDFSEDDIYFDAVAEGLLTEEEAKQTSAHNPLHCVLASKWGISKGEASDRLEEIMDKTFKEKVLPRTGEKLCECGRMTFPGAGP